MWIITLVAMTTNSSHRLIMGKEEIDYLKTPVYEVYRGYLVLAFSVCLCVCVCVNFFSVKDFSGTT